MGQSDVMNVSLHHDPASRNFQEQLSRLPGYPPGLELPLKMMLFADDGLQQLSSVLAESGIERERPLLVLMDTTPMKRGSDDLKPLLLQTLQTAGWRLQPLWLEPDNGHQVHTDFAQIGRVIACLPGCGGLLAVGSGTIADIGKHACYCFEQEQNQAPLPFVIYQTANSVSAFTSNMAPVFVAGVKRTLPSRYATALVCDLPTLTSAPPEMTAAGVGDLLAAACSMADWYLADQLHMDPGYNPLAEALMAGMDDLLLQVGPAIRAGNAKGVAVLAKLISLSGLSMSLCGVTTPFSGYEHVISHVLDLQASLAHEPFAAHGAQVALATVLCTEAYRILLAELQPDGVHSPACYPESLQMESDVTRAFNGLDASGRVAAECWADYSQKLEAWRRADTLPQFLERWPLIRERLDGMVRPPERVVTVLHSVGAPLRFDALQPAIGGDRVQFAFLMAPLIRKRFTSGDLFLFLNWDRHALWQRVWERAGGLATAAHNS